AQLLQDLALLQHLVLAAEDAEVLEHRLAELVADLPRALAGGPVEEILQLALGIALERLRHVDRRVRKRPLRSGAAGPAPEGDRLHQRVATEAVRAVHGDARTLAR